MKRPFLLVQLGDPHVGADWGDGDTVAMLAAAVECVRALEPNPDAVLISGDLADHALDVEYEQVRQLLAPLQAPLSVWPGNHDDRLHCAATSAFPVTAVIPCSEVGLPPADRRAFATEVEGHPQVRRIVAGHTHRTISVELGGRSVLAVPSTYVQALLDFGAKEIEVSNDPPGFAVHSSSTAS
jgi:3',5'-cyclic AMP phosphodiesterase CpdA